jgi:choline dehydrogenase-like flavoprotein
MADSDMSSSAQEWVRTGTGLRVVDASVLPCQVAGNCQVPTMAVAWIAADLQGS